MMTLTVYSYDSERVFNRSIKLLSRVSMLRMQCAMLANTSLRLSDTLWHCLETIAPVVKLIPPSDTCMALQFLTVTAVTKFEGELRQRGGGP